MRRKVHALLSLSRERSNLHSVINNEIRMEEEECAEESECGKSAAERGKGVCATPSAERLLSFSFDTGDYF